MTVMNSRVRFRMPLLIIAGLFITVGIVGLLLQTRLNVFPQLIESAKVPAKRLEFPQVDTANLTATQQKIMTILKAEYLVNPPGTKYSQGVSEPWCADFVSWVLNEAGVPLVNPNSASWRIPGTYTLREYYESTGRLTLAKTGYEPKVGDIMLYDNPSPFGQHTNFVIQQNDGLITTIGGNEPGGIRVSTFRSEKDSGFIGYGTL